MARASGWELEHVNKKAFVRITGVVCQHPLVHVFLGTFALVTWRQKPARRVGGEARLQPRGLGVVVNVVDDHPLKMIKVEIQSHPPYDGKPLETSFSVQHVSHNSCYPQSMFVETS